MFYLQLVLIMPMQVLIILFLLLKTQNGMFFSLSAKDNQKTSKRLRKGFERIKVLE